MSLVGTVTIPEPTNLQPLYKTCSGQPWGWDRPDMCYTYTKTRVGVLTGLTYAELINKAGGTFVADTSIGNPTGKDWVQPTNDLDLLIQRMWRRFSDWEPTNPNHSSTIGDYRWKSYGGQAYPQGVHNFHAMTDADVMTFQKYYNSVFKHTSNNFLHIGTPNGGEGSDHDKLLNWQDAWFLWLLETAIDQGDRPLNPMTLEPKVAEALWKYSANLNILWNEANIGNRQKNLVPDIGLAAGTTWGLSYKLIGTAYNLATKDDWLDEGMRKAILMRRLQFLRNNDAHDWNANMPLLQKAGTYTADSRWQKWHTFESYDAYLTDLFSQPSKKNMFVNMPGYDLFVGIGSPFSFEQFDTDLMTQIKEDFDYETRQVGQMGSEFQIGEQLLDWASFLAVAIINTDDEEWAKAKFPDRANELDKTEQVLPWGPYNYTDAAANAWDYKGQRTQKFIDKLTDQYFMVRTPTGGQRIVERATEFILYDLGDLKEFTESSPPHNLMEQQAKYWNDMGLQRWAPRGTGNRGVDVHDKMASLSIEHYVSAAYVVFIKKFIKMPLIRQGGPQAGVDSAGQALPDVSDLWYGEINGGVKKVVKYIILQNAENEMRIAFIETVKEERKNNPNISTDKLAEAVDQAENAELGDSEHFDLKKLQTTTIDPDLLNDRQRFFKQCALLLNIRTLQTAYVQKLSEKFKKNKQAKPFSNRFYMVQSNSDHDRLYNDLVSSPAAAVLFDLPPAVVSALQPKIRLYKVESNNNDISEIEFTFPVATDINRTKDFVHRTSFLCENYDKGDGVGLRDFSFEFNGTNPAEARTDIAANLSLYFQTFGDLVRDRKSRLHEDKTYKYVDLIIQPTPDENKPTVNGVHIVHPDQYDPAFYRIRAEVGYTIPDDLNVDLGGLKLTDIQEALRVNNQSYYLNQVEHDIQIQKDGSVIVDIEYRAYVESVLKGPNSDALSTRQSIKQREQLQKRLYDELQSGICDGKDVDILKKQLASQKEVVRKNALQNIIKQLRDRDRLYTTQINPVDAQNFRQNGWFNKAELGSFKNATDPNSFEPAAPDTLLNPADPDKSTTSYILNEGIPADFQYNDENDTTIQFFYFADLLYIISDSMYSTKKLGKPREGTENIKFILGGFDFRPYTDNAEAGSTPVNIGTIPISVDYFMHWMLTEVLTQGNARSVFPIIYFIRNLANSLLKTALLEACVNRDVKKAISFQTGTLSAWGKKKKLGHDPLYDETGYQKSTKQANIILSTESLKRKKILPFKSSKKGESDGTLNKYHSYLLLTAQGSQLDKTGRGIYKDDVKDGRYWISIGSNRGIVKSVSFKKSDMMYTREARFFANGIDGLLQLSNVYVATIEMYGNTLFYPGMEVFINPWGLGGDLLGDPTRGPYGLQGASIANKLGFGGYHTIISVKSSIGPGGFNTIIEAQWYFSGDNQGSIASKGKAMGFGTNVANKKAVKCGGTIQEAQVLGWDKTATVLTDNCSAVDDSGTEDNSASNNAQTPTTTTVVTNSSGEDKKDKTKTKDKKGTKPPAPTAKNKYQKRKKPVAAKNRKKKPKPINNPGIGNEDITFDDVLDRLYEDLQQLSQGQCAEKHAQRKDMFETWLEDDANKQKFEGLLAAGETATDIFENEMQRLSDEWDKQYQEDNPLYSDTATEEQRALALIKSKSDINSTAIDNLQSDEIMLLFDKTANQNYMNNKNDLDRLETQMQTMETNKKRYKYDVHSGPTRWRHRYKGVNEGQKLGLPPGITWDKHVEAPSPPAGGGFFTSTSAFDKLRKEYKEVYDRTVKYDNVRGALNITGELTPMSLPSKDESKIQRNLLNPGILPPECLPQGDGANIRIDPFEARVHYVDLYWADYDVDTGVWGERTYNSSDYPFQGDDENLKLPTPPPAPQGATKNYQEDASDILWIAYQGLIWYPGTDEDAKAAGFEGYPGWSTLMRGWITTAEGLSVPQKPVQLPAYEKGLDDYHFLHAIQHDAEEMTKGTKPKMTIEMINQWTRWKDKQEKAVLSAVNVSFSDTNIAQVPAWSTLDNKEKVRAWFTREHPDDFGPLVGTISGPNNTYFSYVQYPQGDKDRFLAKGFASVDLENEIKDKLEKSRTDVLYVGGVEGLQNVPGDEVFDTSSGVPEPVHRFWYFWKKRE